MTGVRGPITGTGGRPRKRTPAQQQKTGNPGRRPDPSQGSALERPVVTILPTSSPNAPAVPDDLTGPSVDLWHEIWSSAPWLSPILDRQGVHEYVQAVTERDEMRATIAKDGLVATEPIVSPRGDVVGTRIVEHPLLQHQRRLEARIDGHRERLGLSAGSRARLGLVAMEMQERARRLGNPKVNWKRP